MLTSSVMVILANLFIDSRFIDTWLVERCHASLYIACLQAVTGGFIAENPFRSVIERHLGFLRRALPGTSGRAQKSREGGGGGGGKRKTNQKPRLLVDGIQTLSWDRPSLPAGGFSPLSPPPSPRSLCQLSTRPRPDRANSRWRPHYEFRFFSTIQPPVCRLHFILWLLPSLIKNMILSSCDVTQMSQIDVFWQVCSLRSWRDFVRECFCFGREAVNACGEAVRRLVKSWVEFPPAQISGVFWIMRSPVHANFGLAESTETSIKC